MSGTVAAQPAAQQKRSSFDPHGVLNELEQKIRPVRSNPLYQLGLLLVAAAMLALPLIYVGLVLLVAYGVYLHAVYDVSILAGRGGARARLFAYVAPIIVGIVFLCFMAKPLFARRVREQRPMTLNRSKEPMLFAYIDRLCTVVGAPKASRIDVDCQVNASASFGESIWSVLSGQLVLTIGIPLVAGLDVRQFTGVIAHELGHFSQGAAMRLTYIIRSVNAWFARVVYERDSWDHGLDGWAQNNEGWVVLIALLVKLLVWLTRRVLWVLMLIGHLISCFMLRQMEYGADRYEARVAGSSCFPETSERIAMLSFGSQAALSSLSDAWRERQLCDDLPLLIGLREQEMPAQIRTKLLEMVHDRRTSLFDTHPSDADRIRNAQKENAPGIITVAAPATVLFSDFPELAKDATMLFYMQILGKQLRPEHVVPTDSIVKQVQKQRSNYESARRFFQDLLHPGRPVFPESLPGIRNEAQAAEQLLELRSTLVTAAPAAQSAAKQYEQANTQLRGVMRVRATATSGLKLAKASEYELAATDQATLGQVTRSATASAAESRQQIAQALTPAMRRLEIALALARKQTHAAQKPTADSYDLAAGAAAGSLGLQLDALRCLASTETSVQSLHNVAIEMGEMLNHLQQDGNTETQISAVVSRAHQARQLLLDLQGTLCNTPYPYEHTEAGATLARYAIRTVPAEEEVGSIYEAGTAAIESIYDLYMRIMSDLAQQAEEIEKGLGLEPLPAPAETADT